MKTKQLTMSEVVGHLRNAGVTGWRLVTLGSIIWAESRGDAYAININDQDPTSEAYLSLDLGLCQINTYWQGVTSMISLDPAKATQWMANKTGLGLNLTALNLWNAYKSGAYTRWLHDMRIAAGL